jgi:hypothetical protein
MKAKYLVISVLIIFLFFIVRQMMRYESSIREERVIEVMVEDNSKPLIKDIPFDALKRLALSSDYYFMTSGDYFEALTTKIEYGEKVNEWEKIFLKGVNMGVALPGKFPSEFSASFDQYLEWFRLIGEMNSNVIRIYTILPPEFYEAFAYYNLLYQNRKLYLLHGVWAKEPLKENYYNPVSQREFRKEIIDVVDVIHGKAVIKPKPGHACGTFVTDISKYVIGIVLGREWEPKAVTFTNRNNDISSFTGDFISVSNANAMEVWLARMMDFTIQYETQSYKAQRPVSFVNWLPLDPMFHSTEFIENEKVNEYDNDLESIDIQKFNVSNLFTPGIFASYHAYPYYPDYIYNERKYASSINNKGDPDNYFGYLKNLKEFHPEIPLVIAEYGLPSSRGNSHYTPFGFNQGGHSEQEQADLSIILTNDIHETECAGAVYFEWIDEWFKHNWMVMDFEQPRERRKFWHNMENPEQNFGIMAVEGRSKVIDGKTNDWDDDISFALSDADPGYFSLVSHIPELDFNKHRLFIAINTYDEEKGEHKLPFLDEYFNPGIEFLLEFNSQKDARILVDDMYSVFTDIYNDSIPVYASKNNNNGVFSEQKLLSNRSRITLTGDSIKRILHNRSNLIHGNSSLSEFSNADWFWNEKDKILELRLTWHLLNVSDPSTRSVLDDIPNTPEIECSKTQGFDIFFFVTDKNNNILEDISPEKPYFFSWEGWEEPDYFIREKPLYKKLQKVFLNMKPLDIADNKSILKDQETFRICDYYGNKDGAVSLCFNDLSYSQYENAVPLLDKYKLKASFGLINEWLHEKPTQIARKDEFAIKRMGIEQLKGLLQQGHSLAIQFFEDERDYISEKERKAELKNQRLILKQKTGVDIMSFYDPVNEKCSLGNTNITADKTISVENADKPKLKEIERLLKDSKGDWLVFQFYHIFPKEAKEYKQISQEKRDINVLSPDILEREIRLIRNSNYWIAPVSEVGKYIIEKDNSTIKTEKYKNLVFLNVINNLDKLLFNQPLSIEYLTTNKTIKVTNSAADGIYNARNNKIYLSVYPNREVTIEILN